MTSKSLGYIILIATLVLVGLAASVRSLSTMEIVLTSIGVVLSLVLINTSAPNRKVTKPCFMPVAYKD